MAEIRKCTVRDGNFVEPCETLAQASNGRPYGTATGIFTHNMTYVEGPNFGKPSRTFFSVKTGEFAKKGICLNFCPFCGEKIDAPFIQTQEP